MLNLQKQYQTQQEALESYLDFVYTGSNSESSVKAYRTAITGSKSGLRVFLQHKYNCHEVQLLTRLSNEELNIYAVLRDYVVFLDKRGIKPKSVRLWFAAVKGYFTYLGVEVFSEKCKQLIKLPKVRKLKKEALTKELILKLLRNVDAKDSTAILMALSSGMRVGEIAALTLDDIDFTSECIQINIRAETTKTREDRETFISTEASEALRDYLKRYFGWKEDRPNLELQGLRIFGRTNKIKGSRLPKE